MPGMAQHCLILAAQACERLWMGLQRRGAGVSFSACWCVVFVVPLC